jgi:Na+/melibiose symporter-like transporter
VPAAKLGPGVRFAYGVGGIAAAVKDATVVHFLLMFYTQVVGLPGAWFGAASGIAQVADALIDPALGAWSDNTRSKLGRRHPFMLGAALPYAAAFWWMFHPRSGLSHLALFAWAAGTMIATRALLAAFAIPHTALGAELSTDYAQRTQIAADRTVLAWLGGILLPAISYGVIFRSSAGVDGRLVAANYPVYALLCVGMILATTFGSALGTRSTIATLPALGERRRLGLLDPFRDVAFALRNRNFRRVFAAIFLAGGITGVSTMFTALMALYFWEFDTTQSALLVLSSVLPTITAFFAIGPLSRQLEKRSLYLATVFALIVSLALPPSARLLGLLPPNGSPAIFALALAANFVSVLLLVLNGSVWPSLIADIADEYEVEHGERKDGVFFAAFAVGQKIPLGLGNALGGFLVGWVGLSQGMRPGTLPPHVLLRMGLVAGPFVAVSLVLPIVVMWNYDLSRARHAELRSAIDARGAKRFAPD